MDLCLREIERHNFLVLIRQRSLNNAQIINTQRRVVIYKSTSEVKNHSNFLQICDALQSASFARTLICDAEELLPPCNFRLLRVLVASEPSQQDDYSFSNCIFQLVNSRFFAVGKFAVKSQQQLPSSIYLFWNLQILCIRWTEINSFDIWKMPLLQCVGVPSGLHLTNPVQDGFVLQNLHVLLDVANFRCSDKVVKRIPNIKIPSWSELVPNLTFPHCLKKFTLKGCHLHWEDISTKIGSLPLLQALRLRGASVIGPEWETIEGQFCSLKILKILNCGDLKCWEMNDSHFPCLERLVLTWLMELEEIPTAIGHIATLRLIELRNCSYSAIIYAKEIAEEQMELDNQDLLVRVQVTRQEYPETRIWASSNFEVKVR